MPRNQPPALGQVRQLWWDHYDQTEAGLRSLTDAVFKIPFVAKNVPRNQSTLKMMSLMVRDMIVCCSDIIQNHLIDQRLPPQWK